MLHLFVVVQHAQVGEHQPAHVTFEGDVGDGVLREQVLVNQRVVVAESRLGDVALVVRQLGHVHGGVLRLWGDFLDHVHVGVAKRGKVLLFCVLAVFVLFGLLLLRLLLVLDLRLLRCGGDHVGVKHFNLFLQKIRHSL